MMKELPLLLALLGRYYYERIVYPIRRVYTNIKYRKVHKEIRQKYFGEK